MAMINSASVKSFGARKNRRIREFARRRLLVLSFCSFIISALVLTVYFLENDSTSVLTNTRLFLFLTEVLGVVLLAPTIYLVTRQRLDFFHPLVYPVIIYLFPAFVIGNLILLTSTRPSWVLTLISDPNYYLNLSMVYIIIGFISLVIGFAVPAASQLGLALSKYIPDWDWSPSATRFPGLILFSLGIFSTWYSIAVGVWGYQILEIPLLTGGTLSALTVLATIGAFMLWHSFFRRDRTKKEIWTPILILLVAQIFSNAVVSGSRYSLLVGLITVLAAFRFAGGRFRPSVIFFIFSVGIVATILGFSLGTTFRQVKGSESVISLVETLNVGGQTISRLTDLGPTGTVGLAVDTLEQRIENLSSFAVIVSNYERLKPLEVYYGIENNIWIYTWTALIPRFLWPNKPIISDARAVGALYFNFPTNSFAMTMFGDLLRNFGPIGVPIGMLILGFMLRILYSAFVTQHVVPAWRAATYFSLLISVNYESFYGTVLPSWIRIGFVCLVGGFIANAIFLARIKSKNS
jgi:hypothetical protein